MNAPRPKVGLLALTLELYESLAPELRSGREQWLSGRVLPELAKLADVSFQRVVYRREDIEAAVAAYQAEGVDALLVMHLTYSVSQLPLPALKQTNLPILLWNTQELHAVDDSFTDQTMIDNHGIHGTQDLANVLLRSGVRFEYITSHLDDAGATQTLGDFFAAAAARRRLRNARLGLMGYPFPAMGDFALDTTHLVATLGCQPLQLPVSEYIERAEAAGEKEAADLAAEYRRTYDVADGVTETDLDSTARVEIALRGMAADRGLEAVTYQFSAFGEDPRTLTTPFVAASRMMADGIGFGGEGDLIAATGTLLLNWLQPPATFTEMFTTDFAGNAIFMSHMGEANAAMARTDRKTLLVARPFPITSTRHGQLALQINLQPGPATLAALTLGRESRWRIVASPAAIVDYGPLASMAVPHFKLRPDGDIRDFLTAYAKAGGPHHNAVCFGDARGKLRALAGMIDADYREV